MIDLAENQAQSAAKFPARPALRLPNALTYPVLLHGALRAIEKPVGGFA